MKYRPLQLYAKFNGNPNFKCGVNNLGQLIFPQALNKTYILKDTITKIIGILHYALN